MDNTELYKSLTTILWQDYNGFLRFEKERSPKLDEEKKWLFLLLFIPGVNLLYLIAEIIKWIVLLFIILKGKSSRRSITNCTYDIEVNTKNYKVIRNKNGKIGLCYWEDWYHNSILIKPIYTAIERVDDISYILKTNGRYGLYNGNRKKNHIGM